MRPCSRLGQRSLLHRRLRCGRCAAAAVLCRPGEALRRGRVPNAAHELGDLAPVCAAAGVPDDLGGCHRAKVAGYVVEGHAPVTTVQRPLAERPAVLGLAVPGMPMNAPGIEVEGQPVQPPHVIVFVADGRPLARHRPLA
jgi:hypothetical protein